MDRDRELLDGFLSDVMLENVMKTDDQHKIQFRSGMFNKDFT
jgi:hypothetical protein